MRQYIQSVLATVVVLTALPPTAVAEGERSVRRDPCQDLVSRGEEALRSGRDVAAAFAFWREASAKCDVRDLEPISAARLLSSQSLLPENAATAAAQLDQAVGLLDRNDPEHWGALVDVLRRRSASEAYRDAPGRVEADLQSISDLQEERFGRGSPEALSAQVNLLVMRALQSVRSSQIERARTDIATLESFTADGAKGEATLTRDSLLALHGALQEIYTLLGDPKASERHEMELERLARLH